MSVLRRFPATDVFIETGFGGGDTLKAACEQPYRALHSIEIDRTLLEAKRDQFAGDSRVHLHHGSSPDILSHVCQPMVSTCFWLDAHYSAGQYSSDSQHDLATLDPAVGQCALLAELAVIRSIEWRVPPIILIDDAACINADTYEGMYAQHDRSQYPTLRELFNALPVGYALSQHDDGSGWYFRAERV